MRELAHVVERAVILSQGGCLTLALPESAPPLSVAPPAMPEHGVGAVRTFDDLRRVEIAMIEGALAASDGRVSGRGGAAERLGINPSTLRDRIKSLGIRR